VVSTLNSPPKPSRHIDVVVALDPEVNTAADNPTFTSRPAPQLPSPDWPPDQWD